MRAIFTLLFAVFFVFNAFGQVFTKEDSLQAGLVRSNQPTVVSGYGQAKVEYDLKYKTGQANLTRNVLFIGHKFSKKVYFFSEMELENAGVSSSGGFKGELSMEQLFLKFNINRDVYLTAGLFIPRIGIINENHLPTTFNGNDRPFVETLIIPATWRELGVGVYGNVRRVPGLNYSFAVMNGLNSAGFNNGTGIADGRFEGSQASASNIAVTGAVLYYYRNWRLQASGYFGGSAGLVKRVADSLQLRSGPFGTPVGVVEANVQYHNKGVSFKALATSSHIPDAFRINRAYANNTPTAMLGAYAEAGYNIFNAWSTDPGRSLVFFVRYEWMDLNQSLPSNGIVNPTLRRSYVVTGLTFQPTQGIAVKLDYVMRQTGERNPELVVTPFPQALPYYTSNGFLNLGFGYSF